jgi:hypothetical protein
MKTKKTKKTSATPSREAKLETAVKAALRLRKNIELRPEYPVKALLVPVWAVEAFDEVMEELSDERR